MTGQDRRYHEVFQGQNVGREDFQHIQSGKSADLLGGTDCIAETAVQDRNRFTSIQHD